jgi:hypothetical protein
MSSSQKEQIFLPRVPSRTISKEHSSFNARSSRSRARARLSLSRRKTVIKLMSFSSLDATRKFNTPRRFSSSGSGSGGGSYKKSNPGIADDAFFRFFLSSSSSSIARSLGKFVHQFNDCRQRKKDIVSVALF